MVRRFSKRLSKHALNSIHKSCKLQHNWFKCEGLGKRQKNKYSPIRRTLFPPLMSMRCTNTISWSGIHSRPQRPRSFWCWPKGARPLGIKGSGMGEISKARDLVESYCWHRTAWGKCVVPVSLTQNMNAWDANCLLAINAQCLNKTRTLRDRQPVKALYTARFLTGA